MYKSLQTPLLITLIILIFITPIYAETYDLQLNLKKGDIYVIDSIVTKRYRDKYRESSVEYSANLSSTFQLIVIEETDLTLTFSFKYSRLSIESEDFIQIKGAIIPIPGVVTLTDFIADKGFSMVIYKCGEVKEFIGLEQFTEDIYNHLIQSDAFKEMGTAKEIKELYSSETMTDQWNIYINYIPTIPVPVEKTWENELPLLDPIRVEGIVKYDLTDSTENLYAISITSEFSGKEIVKENLYDEATKVDMEAIFQGKLTIDNDTNWFRTLRIIQVYDGYHFKPHIDNLFLFHKSYKIWIESHLVATRVYPT